MADDCRPPPAMGYPASLQKAVDVNCNIDGRTYFEKLEEENSYLRHQLFVLLHEIRGVNVEVDEGANGANASDGPPEQRRHAAAAADDDWADCAGHLPPPPLPAVAAADCLADECNKRRVLRGDWPCGRRRLQTQQRVVRGCAADSARHRLAMFSDRPTSDASTAPDFHPANSSYQPTASKTNNNNNSTVSSQAGENPSTVSALEGKLAALERKYELQAVRHRQLDAQLNMLRQRATSSSDALPTTVRRAQTATAERAPCQATAEAQTSPDDESRSWALPDADAVHGSPAHSARLLRRAASDSRPLRAAGCASRASCSTDIGIARDGGCARQLPNSSARSSGGRSSSRRSPRPAIAEVQQWMRDRPADARLFRALFQYLPWRDSPNENASVELALEPGDLVLIYGDLDEDLFYSGELFSGETGLVPSNYVERVADAQLLAAHDSLCTAAAQPTSCSASAAADALRPRDHAQSPEMQSRCAVSSPLSFVHRSEKLPISKKSVSVPLSSCTGVRLHNAIMANGPDDCAFVPPNSDVQQSGLPDSICPYPPVDVCRVSVHEVRHAGNSPVPFPRDILVEKQLARSVVISWSPPSQSLAQVSQYHVCVDGAVKAVVPGGYKCKALIDDLDLSCLRRVSVRAVVDSGHSADAACTLVVGRAAQVAPLDVRASQVTPVSVQLGWYPSNSNCEHLVLLNGLKVGACPAGVHEVLLKGLSPSTMYRAAIRTKDPKAVLEEKLVEGFCDLKTLPKIGLPDAPSSVQCETGPQDGTLLVSWQPVDSQPQPPSRAAVAAYMIYADGRKLTEVAAPNCDHVLLKLADFLDDPPLFITVRTRTREGAVSGDSNVVRAPRLSSPRRHRPLDMPSSVGRSAFARRHGAAQMSPSRGFSVDAVNAPSDAPRGLLMIQPPPLSASPTATVFSDSSSQVTFQPSIGYQRAATAALPFVEPSPAGAMQVSYGLWPGMSAVTSGVTYTRAYVPAQTTSVLSMAAPAVATSAAANQYYVFHPRLSKTEPTVEKPSLLEMENAYLVKHAADVAFRPTSTRHPNLALHNAYQPQGRAATRTLPAIDPTTGLPFRSNQYVQPWQTLSPATRRRLEQYVHGRTANGRSAADMEALLRRELLARRRAAVRKRSYSADEQLDDYELAAFAHAINLPHIRITGASGSEGPPSSAAELDDYDWDYLYANKPSLRRRYYAERCDSRAQSEPDLRDDPRLMAMADGRRARLFVALYDYEPRHMSPNPNAAHDEVPFHKGQLVKVYGSKDGDGFYVGSVSGRLGLIPGNMVAPLSREDVYAMRGAARHDDYRSLDYDPFYAGGGRGGAYGHVAATCSPQQRRRSDVDRHRDNHSDPTLASFHAGAAYTDYDSSTSADRAFPPVDPRIRRMRFSQLKSRSYDSDYARGRRANELPPTGRSGRPPADYQHYAYERDRRRRDEPPLSDRYDAADEYGMPRDRREHSLPARASPEESERRRRTADARPERQRVDAADHDYYYATGRPTADDYGAVDEQRRRAPPAERREPTDRRTDERAYREMNGRSAQYRSGGPVDRYRVEVEPKGRRAASELPADYDGSVVRPDGYPPTIGSNPPIDGGYGAPQPQRQLDAQAHRGPPDSYYERDERRRGSFRRGGRDQLEESIREAVREAPARRMVAKYHYNAREASPNVDAEQVELNFRSGDCITIYGEMDEDGFYIGELNGRRGLVPSNFLEPYGSSAQPQQQQQQAAVPPTQPPAFVRRRAVVARWRSLAGLGAAAGRRADTLQARRRHVQGAAAATGELAEPGQAGLGGEKRRRRREGGWRDALGRRAEEVERRIGQVGGSAQSVAAGERRQGGRPARPLKGAEKDR